MGLALFGFGPTFVQKSTQEAKDRVQASGKLLIIDFGEALEDWTSITHANGLNAYDIYTGRAKNCTFSMHHIDAN